LNEGGGADPLDMEERDPPPQTMNMYKDGIFKENDCEDWRGFEEEGGGGGGGVRPSAVRPSKIEALSSLRNDDLTENDFMDADRMSDHDS